MPMKKSAREFNCARCHKQVVICSPCDRGNIYCGRDCSRRSRALNHRIANQIYQKTLNGRQKHAQRQHRYRQREKEKRQKVTDQGSNDLPPNDLLTCVPGEEKSQEIKQLYCHFCRNAVSTFLRNGYLRHHQEDKQRDSSSWPLGP